MSSTNFYYKLNNFQLFNRGDSNMRTSRKKDDVIFYDMSCNVPAEKTKDKIKIYCKGKSFNINFNNEKKKAISGKHYSYERYLAKKKVCVIDNMIQQNAKYYIDHIQDNNKNFNKLHNPCTWKSQNYIANLNYKNMPRDTKNPFNKKPLPNGPAGAKSCCK